MLNASAGSKGRRTYVQNDGMRIGIDLGNFFALSLRMKDIVTTFNKAPVMRPKLTSIMNGYIVKNFYRGIAKLANGIGAQKFNLYHMYPWRRYGTQPLFSGMWKTSGTTDIKFFLTYLAAPENDYMPFEPGFPISQAPFRNRTTYLDKSWRFEHYPDQFGHAGLPRTDPNILITHASMGNNAGEERKYVAYWRPGSSVMGNFMQYHNYHIHFDDYSRTRNSDYWYKADVSYGKTKPVLEVNYGTFGQMSAATHFFWYAVLPTHLQRANDKAGEYIADHFVRGIKRGDSELNEASMRAQMDVMSKDRVFLFDKGKRIKGNPVAYYERKWKGKTTSNSMEKRYRAAIYRGWKEVLL